MKDSSYWSINISREAEGNLFAALHTLPIGTLIYIGHRHYTGEAQVMGVDPDAIRISTIEENGHHGSTISLAFKFLDSIHVY